MFIQTIRHCKTLIFQIWQIICGKIQNLKVITNGIIDTVKDELSNTHWLYHTLI